ncbi:MAG TPA: TIGR03067 domain-containing protein [Sediminibacterium sp.]|nr:TIGR03067 domain-containing protein [Sediminibacterium sp.]
MRKQILLIPCLLFAALATAQETGHLNGSWKPEQQEFGGKPFPATVFEKYRLVINDTVYTYGGADIDQGALKFGEGKMDIYGRKGVNAGKHFTAIYKFEGGKLYICYNLSGGDYPRAFETTSAPLLFLSVYTKEEK